jgi:NitT/TauT family transport system substrate-binding protein
VGGKNLLYYLPLTIAEQRGYFKAEGLDVTIVDFAGGARALQAVVGGSADVVSGAFEHTVNMQHKGQRCAPSCCRAARRRSCWASTPRPWPATRPWPT